MTSNICSLRFYYVIIPQLLIIYSLSNVFVEKYQSNGRTLPTAMNINEDILEDISDEETNDFHKFCRVIEE